MIRILSISSKPAKSVMLVFATLFTLGSHAAHAGETVIFKALDASGNENGACLGNFGHGQYVKPCDASSKGQKFMTQLANITAPMLTTPLVTVMDGRDAKTCMVAQKPDGVFVPQPNIDCDRVAHNDTLWVFDTQKKQLQTFPGGRTEPICIGNNGLFEECGNKASWNIALAQ